MSTEAAQLEKAAKYLCTLLDGMCPMAVESYPCPTDCTIDTAPWQCWVVYFQARGTRQEDEENS